MGAEALRGLAAELELHADFSEVLASLARGESGTLGGVWGSSRALVAAALARRCAATLVVVLPHAGEVDPLAADLALFTSAEAECLAASEGDADERVLQDQSFGGRQRLLKRLATHVDESAAADSHEVSEKLRHVPAIVVTSIQALLEPVPSPEQLAAEAPAEESGAANEAAPLDE